MRSRRGCSGIRLTQIRLWEASPTAIRTVYNSNPITVGDASHSLEFPDTFK